MTDVLVDDETEHTTTDVDPVEPSPWPARLTYLAVIAIVLTLAGLTGWLGFRAYAAHRAAEQRELFLQVGRQEAINLTSIDFTEADADIQRILDSATGGFYDDFAKRSQPFVDVVKQVKSKTVGTVTAAGLESASDTSAKVLVAVTVQTSRAGMAPQDRSWRMRLTVDQTSDGARVSNVEFVP